MFFFVGGRAAFEAAARMDGRRDAGRAGGVLAVLLRHLLAVQRRASATSAGWRWSPASALAFVTVAIPLQLEHQWITIGWALEGAALAWLLHAHPAPRPALLLASRCSPPSSCASR